METSPCTTWRCDQLIAVPSKIVAIGRNYSEHAKELNNAVPKEPIIFLKPTTSYLPSGGNMEIPKGVVAHYEGAHSSPSASIWVLLRSHKVELGVVVGKRGREIPESEAESYVAGYGDTPGFCASWRLLTRYAQPLPWT